MDADDALRAIMDAIEIDTVGEAPAVRFTPLGLADLAGALADMITAARTEGEAAGYRRAIDDACAAITAAAKEVTAGGNPEWGGYDDGRWDALKGIQHDVRKLAPVEPVSNADELPGAPKGGTP